jgi:hypothetical protein
MLRYDARRIASSVGTPGEGATLTALIASPPAPLDGATLALLTFLCMVTVVILVLQKALATNHVPPRPRMSRTLDVGLIPLGLGALALGASQLARLIASV